MESRDPCLLENERHSSFEILLSPELLEQIFSIQNALGFESLEEKVYREQKEEYNNNVLSKIKDIAFTEKQKSVMEALFFRDLTMAQCAIEMKVAKGTIQKIKEQLIKKIRKRVKYNFILKDE